MITIGLLTSLMTLFTATDAKLTVLSTEWSKNQAVISADAGVTPLTLEMYVREYFSDDPILAEIARCESTFRHVGKNGTIIRGKVDPADIGVMQINERYHNVKAIALGFDLKTIEGNMAYAKYLYEKEGLKPWNPSKPCWGKSEAYRELAIK